MGDHSFCRVVEPSSLGDARLREIESLLATVSGVIKGHLAGSGLKSSFGFFKELLRSYRSGCGCVVGSTKVSAGDAALMMRVKDVEGDLLGHFSMMVEQVVGLCARSYGRDGDGLHADAYEAFVRAMLNYNGSVRFSTFLHKCISRHLRRVCSNDSAVRVPADVRRLSMRVVGKMGEGASFDEAVEGLGRNAVEGVLASMRRVQTATELEVGESELVAVEDKESLEWVTRAVEGVSFTRLEREALRGFMESPQGVMGLSSNLKNLINPATGRPYSRAAVSAAWAQARKKIRRALEAA